MGRINKLLLSFLTVLVISVCGNNAWCEDSVFLYGESGNGIHDGDVVDKKEFFRLDRPFNVVADLGDTYAETMGKRVVKFMQKQDCNMATLSNGISKRNITIRSVKSIPGVPADKSDAFMINVNKNDISIVFTSPKSMRWAMNSFMRLYTKDISIIGKVLGKSKGYITGKKILQFNSDEGGVDVIDASAQEADIISLTEKIKKSINQNNSTIYLIIASEKGWPLKCKTLGLINPTESICSNAGYTLSDLTLIYDLSQEEGVDIIPVFDLISPNNEIFKSYTGHDIHSVEGLRFTRAILNEFCDVCPFEKISIGRKNDQISDKYIIPLAETLKSRERQAIIF